MGVYQRGKIWYVRFQINGEPVNESAGTTSKREAKAYEEELRRRKTRELAGLNFDLHLADAIADYIEHADAGRTDLKPNTLKRYKVSYRQIGGYIATLEGAMISEMTATWVKRYVDFRQKQGVKNRTIRRDLDALSVVFTYLDKNRHAISRNSVRDFDVEAIPEKKEEIRVPTQKEIQKIIDDMGPMLGRIAAIQALTGLRQQEALQLEWRDVDLEHRRIIVTKSKSSRPRTILLFGSVIEMLKDIPRHSASDYVFWHGSKGERYRRFANQWKSFTKRLGLPIRDHDLRHFYAWLYLRRGGPLEGLKIQMGHAEIKTTEQYAHLKSDIAELDLARMGEEVVTKVVTPTDITFSFDKCGSYKQQAHAGWPKKGDS